MGNLILFRFFGELNDFLDVTERNGKIEYAIDGNPSVKDAMEAIGIPHPEVGLIVVNGNPVDFTHQGKDGEFVEVYPLYGAPSHLASRVVPFRPEEEPRFVLDVHLGRLARFLRVAGFDVLYENEDMGDKKIAEISAAEERILLTRDVGLLKRSVVRFGHWLRNRDSREQFKEVVNYYGLKKLFDPFSRCVSCNGSVGLIPKKRVEHRLPEGIRRDKKEIFECENCKQLYWKGTHYRRVKAFLDAI